MLRLLRPAVLLVALSLVAGACVWPVPLPGAPVPAIDVVVEQHAADGVVSVTVTATDIDLSSIHVWPDGLAGPPAVSDGSAPWFVEFSTDAMTPGPHALLVLATDGTTFVGRTVPYEIHGCNGHLVLCERRYDEVRYVTAHNAMSSADDGWTGPNQTLDVPAQLATGVRGLMLDTYRAGDDNGFGSPQVAGVAPDTAYLCHSLCVLGSQRLDEGLQEIADFLDANPGEVVTLIIESYLSHALTADAFSTAGLDDDTYVHPSGVPWPTLGELVDAGTRLVVVQDRAVDAAHPWLMNVWEHSFETHFSNTVPGDFSCADNRGSPSNDLFILNHFLTAVFGSPDLADQVNHDPLLSDRIVECEAFHGAVANFVTVDFVEIGDVFAAVDALNGV